MQRNGIRLIFSVGFTTAASESQPVMPRKLSHGTVKEMDCISCWSHCSDKMSSQKQLKEEGFILAHSISERDKWMRRHNWNVMHLITGCLQSESTGQSAGVGLFNTSEAHSNDPYPPAMPHLLKAL